MLKFNSIVKPSSSSSFVTVLFCGYVVYWYLQLGSRISILGAIRFEFIYATILIILGLIFIDKTNLRFPLSKHFGAYLIVLIFQLITSYDFQISWAIFIDRIIKFMFLGIFIVLFVRKPKDLKLFLIAFMLACLKIGLEGFLGTLTGSMIWENQGVPRLHGVTSLYAHPNSLAGNALGSLPFVFCLLPLANMPGKVALLVQLVFALNIILHSGSRTGYVGLLVLALFVVFREKIPKAKILMAILLLVCMLPMIPQPYVDRFESIFTLQEKEGHSSEKRIEILEDAWEVFQRYPLGVGVGAFPSVRNDLFGRQQDTHNLYLEVLTNLGFPGFIIFFLLVYKLLSIVKIQQYSLVEQIDTLETIYLNITKTKSTVAHISDLRLMLATLRAVYMFIVVRLALGFFGMDLYEIYWWFAAGTTIAIYNMNLTLQEITKQMSTISAVPAAFPNDEKRNIMAAKRPKESLR